MIKKSIFIVLAMFGLSAVAGMHSMNHMSDMMSGGEMEESSFMGAFEIKHKAIGEADKGQKTSYRVRLGWKGDVNEFVKWGASVSSAVETYPTTYDVVDLHLEQAYVSYSPMEGLSIMAGKRGWMTKFNKTGILYDDDLYAEGVSIKYHRGDQTMRYMVKVALYELNDAYSGPLTEGKTLKGKLGGHFALPGDMMASLHLSATYDGLFKEIADPVTLAQLKVNVSSSSMMVPAGVFGAYVTNVEGAADSHSFTGGIYVGNAFNPASGEMNSFGLAVSYYDINSNDYNTALMDTDYVSGGDVNGVAVRGQYNVLDNTNIVLKYAYDLNDGGDVKDSSNLVGELTFNF